MEGFLSLPRFAKGGIAVLLAVALLGWAIVAYSAKRQHEDARSLENAVATLKSQGDREETALLERKSLEERLAAAEAELVGSQEALATGREEKSEIEAKLAELEAAFAEAGAPAEGTDGQGGALALLDRQRSTDEDGSGAGEAGMVDAETLRARLTETMTSLSAKNAMLQQRDRELARAEAAAEAAAADVEALEAAALERDKLRDRLTANMTTLSAKSATLQQRGRELSRAQEEVEARTAEIADLRTAIEERDALRDRLTSNMTALSARSATVQQRDRELARLKSDYDEALTSIEALEAASADREAAGRSLDAATAKLASTKQALNDGADALEKNQQALSDQNARLQELQSKQASIEAALAEKEAEVGQQEQRLATLAEDFDQEEQRLSAQRQEIEAVKAELANLVLAREEGAAENSSLVAEGDSLQASLTEREDAISVAEGELERLNGDIVDAELRLAEKETEIEARQSQLLTHGTEIQGAEASLAALKADRAMAEAETIELKKAINRQQTALADLEALKGEIGEAKVELTRQASLLDEKRREMKAAEDRLAGVERSRRTVSVGNQSLPRIPIAELSADNTAVLPVDPMQEPYPVQTELGVRLALVHFDLGSAELTPGGARRAKEAAAWIKQQGIEKIRLIGATDTIGTKENNMALAKRRAQTLFETFAAEGIDPGRIELISMGEDGGGEIIDDQTAEPLNRCVGVFIGG